MFEEIEFELAIGHKCLEVCHTVGYVGFNLEFKTFVGLLHIIIS